MTTETGQSRAPYGGAGYFDPDNLEARELVPGVHARLIWGERIMMGIIDFEPNAVVPWHSHMHEQCGRLLSGSALFELGTGEKKMLKAGEHYVIPGHVTHQVTATSEGCQALDIWSPIREEYLADEIGFFNQFE